MNRLASASECIKIWSSDHDNPIKSFNPHSRNVNAIKWNHNNQVLASVSDDGIVRLSHASGVVLGSFGQHQSLSESNPSEDVEELYAVAFSSGSRYLATGGSSCSAKIYDLRKKSKLRGKF